MGPIFCGVDIGASATKVVLLSGQGEIIGQSIKKTGVDLLSKAEQCLSEALMQANVKRGDLARIVGTGFGRNEVTFADDESTEIRCHGLGAYHYYPRKITVVDIGGEDNKVIRLDDKGGRLSFKMNRKCAAGTGAFIEETAGRMDVSLKDLDSLARKADKPVKLSSFCTVFAKTELLRRTREGATLPNLVRGVLDSVVTRITEMGRFDGEVVMTGGVAAHVPVVADLLSERIGYPVNIPPNPQLIGALGAALVAGLDYRKGKESGNAY
ncbi:MAG: ATPase [Deltaproteobacteria bacterium]|nr:ATPase [Deltaproteobacteria bacterium]